MKTSHHPDSATLMAYAAGTLDEAFAVVVSCHLNNCSTCTQDIEELEAIGGVVLDKMSEKPLSDGAFGRVLEKIYVADQNQGNSSRSEPAQTRHHPGTPAALNRYVDAPISEIRWKKISPGVWQKMLDVGEGAQSSLRLLKIASGKKVPEHGHGGHEMTLILEGAYEDEMGTFSKGDVADLDGDVEHQPFVVSKEDCICLVAIEAPTKFKSLTGKLMQKFIDI